MAFELKNEPVEETKSEWMLRNPNLIPSCFDDGIILPGCRQCGFKHCNNRRKIQQAINRGEME